MKNYESSPEIQHRKISESAQLFTCGIGSSESDSMGIIIHRLVTKAPIEETLEAVFEYYGYKRKETIKCLLESVIKNKQEKTL